MAGFEDGAPFAAVFQIREGREASLQIATMLKEMWAKIGFDRPVQGNLDPAVLKATPEAASREAVRLHVTSLAS